MNALVMADSLQRVGVDTRVQTAIAMQQVAEAVHSRSCTPSFTKGRIVILEPVSDHPTFQPIQQPPFVLQKLRQMQF